MGCFAGFPEWGVTRVGDGVDKKLNTPMEGGDRLGWVDRLGLDQSSCASMTVITGAGSSPGADDGFEGHRLWGPALFVLDE